MIERRRVYTVADTPVSVTLTRKELVVIVAELMISVRQWSDLAASRRGAARQGAEAEADGLRALADKLMEALGCVDSEND